jgi:hypothetical protein
MPARSEPEKQVTHRQQDEDLGPTLLRPNSNGEQHHHREEKEVVGWLDKIQFIPSITENSFAATKFGFLTPVIPA